MGGFNLLDALAFYGQYHANTWNQLIHLVFVPGIFWSLLVWLAALGPLPLVGAGTVLPAKLLGGLPVALQGSAVLNAPAVFMAAYSIFYMSMDLVAGVSWAACLGLPLWLTATAFQQQVPNAWAWALGVQVISWFMQIVPGHAVLEKRKPALLDSLVQAFALAPLFVWFEVLFWLGYRPKLHSQLQQRVRASIAAWKAKSM